MINNWCCSLHLPIWNYIDDYLRKIFWLCACGGLVELSCQQCACDCWWVNPKSHLLLVAQLAYAVRAIINRGSDMAQFRNCMCQKELCYNQHTKGRHLIQHRSSHDQLNRPITFQAEEEFAVWYTRYNCKVQKNWDHTWSTKRPVWK